MLLGDARVKDELGLDIEKPKHRTIDDERIRDTKTKNHRGARIEAFGKGQIHESEERLFCLPIRTKALRALRVLRFNLFIIEDVASFKTV
jgi:hypothetical protein